MLNGSVRVLAPATVGMMSGMSGTMCRSVSAAAMSKPYVWSLLELLGTKQNDFDETDHAESTLYEDHHHLHHDTNSSLNSRHQSASRVCPSPRSGHGPTTTAAASRASANMYGDNGPAAAVMDAEGDVDGEVGEGGGSSRNMVLDYVHYCLQKEDIDWAASGQRDLARPSQLQEAMRTLGDELGERHGEDMDANVSRLHLTAEGGREKMKTVMRELFYNGVVSWGRIVALVAFTGKLAVQCAKEQQQQQRQRDHLLTSMVDWVSEYLDTDPAIRTWVAHNHGWRGLVEFSRGPDRDARDSGHQMRSLFKVFAAAAVGVVTLGALIKKS